MVVLVHTVNTFKTDLKIKKKLKTKYGNIVLRVSKAPFVVDST